MEYKMKKCNFLEKIFGSYWSAPKIKRIKLKGFELCFCYQSHVSKNVNTILIPYPFIALGNNINFLYRYFAFGIGLIFFALYIELRKTYEL
jgi:hypothetical protein